MYNLITILGPTATGKTSLAALLAHRIGGEVISADSRQVYKGMDIGTGKDVDDYIIDGNLVPSHLLDVAQPGYEFNVFEFRQHFYKAFHDITVRKKIPVLCGGSGMYIDAVLRDYQMPEVPVNEELRQRLAILDDKELIQILKEKGTLHNTTDTTDRERTIRAIEILTFQENDKSVETSKPQLNSLTIGILYERSLIRERITLRLTQRLEHGMIEEVHGLLSGGLTPAQLSFYGLEYRYLTQYVMGELSYDEMFNKLNIAIHQFAKRQMTWFRRMEKKGVKIHWIDGTLSNPEKTDQIISMLKS